MDGYVVSGNMHINQCVRFPLNLFKGIMKSVL